MKRYYTTGFSLMGLLVTVALIGILSAIAYPNYQDSVLKSYRREAQAALVQLQLFMERKYTEDHEYPFTSSANGSPRTAPARITSDSCPSCSINFDRYNFFVVTATTANGPRYRIEATPKGPQKADACGVLIYNAAGIGYTRPEHTGCW